MPARESSRVAFTVRSSGSPGPAPTKYTLPITPLRSLRAAVALPAGNARTSARLPDDVAAPFWNPRYCLQREGVPSQRPAIRATVRTQDQIAFPVANEDAAPAPDSSR